MAEASDLDPLAPADALDLYLKHRKGDLSKKSFQNYKYRLQSFVHWCELEGIDNLNDLTGRDLQRFRIWRRDDGGEDYDPVSNVTLKGILATFRVFLEFCANIDAVEPGMRERVILPEVDEGEDVNDEKLEPEVAKRLLDYLDRYQYASRDHVITAILWHTGIRLGTLRAFDLDDWDPDGGYLAAHHRPETETPLKNGAAAERVIAVGPYYTQVIEEFVDTNRDDVYDDYGRRPLISSREGRYSETSIRETVYRLTLPCTYASCPHEREPETCDWTHRGQRQDCPSSRSPHGIRRGSITMHLREGTPEQVVSDRMNVSRDILEKHYDMRTEREKADVRREFIEDL